MLDNHLKTADLINEFEKSFIKPVAKKRDALYELMAQSTTAEAKEKYDKIDNQVRFLESMVGYMRKCLNTDALLIEHFERMLNATTTESYNTEIQKLKQIIYETNN